MISSGPERVDWMYRNQDTSQQDKDEFLLGKAIPEGADRVDTEAATVRR